ncbi:tetratricopeptide repeat protein [Nonomuraea sp. NPDC050394]|uniref:tetratricopeptide repeat protein n=1 Tax=Nonomuraea sp. NPDC050394 TaxID=3364363 RepID=UPI00379B1B32
MSSPEDSPSTDGQTADAAGVGGPKVGGPVGGDHVDFHDNVFHGKVVGAEHHHHYPPKPAPGQIVEGDIPQCPPGFQPRTHLLQQVAGVLGDQATGHTDTEVGTGGGAAVICAVGGTPGVGKTMLAASYAWACQAERWPVVAWIPAEAAEQIHTGLAGLAERLGERHADDDAVTAAARAKAWLAATDRPALVVFDNASEVETVRRWCPATGAARVLVTTRNRAFLRLFEPVEVEVFTPDQAAAFLHRRTGVDDADGAAELAVELGYLPLALNQAAAMIARLRLSYPDYLALLREVSVIEYLPAQRGDPYPRGTAEAILLSVTQAEATLPSAAELLPLLAMLSPAGVPLAVLHAGSGDGAERMRLQQALADLADTSLITFSEDGTAVVMHRLVQRVLRERAAHEGKLNAVLDRATDLFHSFNNTLPKGARTWTARAAVEVLIEQSSELHRHAHTHDMVTAGLLTLRGWCGSYLRELADLTRAIPLLEATLTDSERVLGADHPDTLTARNNLAGAHYTAGDLRRAIPLFEATLTDSERVLGADHPYTLTARNNLAGAHYTAGDLRRAIPLLEAALTDSERVLGADHPYTLTARNNLAHAYQEAGDLGRATPLLKATLTDRERVLGPDHPHTLTTRNNLAHAHRAAGDLGRAIPLLEATLTDSERVLGPDHPDTLASRNSLASAYQEAGDLGRAIPLLEITLTDSERVLGPDHPTTRVVRSNLAKAVARDRGR